ncbi:MAG: rod shape-determining protein MreC [Candidatus Zapsychrus exili]|nr:rod shape-determining protein MreC [Candidatus Zapsychrus exili]
MLPFFLFFVRPNFLNSFKLKLVEITASPIRLISIPIKEAKKILYYHRTFDEYKKVKAQADVLSARLIGFEEVSKENSRLERLLEFKRRSIYSSVAANVVGRNPSHWNSSIIIDKGSRNGIKQGFSVVNSLGIVGKVLEVSENISKVMLIVDPQFSVAALVQRPRESGLISGTLQGMCRMRYLSEDVEILEGDKVITSKLSSSFPEGLLIGKVISVNQSLRDSSLECIVQPAVSFSQIEEVLVIVK